jgi:hypothetical protein
MDIASDYRWGHHGMHGHDHVGTSPGSRHEALRRPPFLTIKKCSRLNFDYLIQDSALRISFKCRFANPGV